jgi:hypothetical protein
MATNRAWTWIDHNKDDDDGYFVAVAANTSIAAMSFDAGESWVPLYLSRADDWRCVGAHKDTIIVVGNNNTAFAIRSTDRGATWQNRTLPMSCNRIKYVGGIWWAFNSMNWFSTMCRSTDDGNSWELVTVGSANSLTNDIDYGNGVFRIIRSTQIFQSNDDGDNWSLIYSTGAALRNIVYFDGVWQAVLDSVGGGNIGVARNLDSAPNTAWDVVSVYIGLFSTARRLYCYKGVWLLLPLNGDFRDDHSVIRSLDGGLTWTRHDNILTTNVIRPVYAFGEGVGIAPIQNSNLITRTIEV